MSLHSNPETVHSFSDVVKAGREQELLRRRFQKGTLLCEGQYVKQWKLRYVSYAIDESGKEIKTRKKVTIGTLADYPTERLAKREADKLMVPVNANAGRPKHLITLSSVTKKFKDMIVPKHKLSSQRVELRQMDIIEKQFGDTPIAEISLEQIERWISGLDYSPKYVRNIVSTFRLVWKKARKWGYIDENRRDPFEEVDMPKRGLVNKPTLTPEQIREVIRKADEPYRTMFWLIAESGIRGGEACGLLVEDVDLENCLVHVRRSAFEGKLQTPKTGNAVRSFPISRNLVEHLRGFICGGVEGHASSETPTSLLYSDGAENGARASDNHAMGAKAPLVIARGRDGEASIKPCPQKLLFCTESGHPFRNGDVVTDRLKPILRAMGADVDGLGLHGFRRANMSVMGSIGTQTMVIKDRVGHADFKTSMGYMTSNSEDHKHAAARLGEVFDPGFTSSASGVEGHAGCARGPAGVVTQTYLDPLTRLDQPSSQRLGVGIKPGLADSPVQKQDNPELAQGAD